MDTVRYLTFPTTAGIITHTPILIGQARGYFADEHVSVEVEHPAEPGAARVARGEADCTIGHPLIAARPAVRGGLQAILLADENRVGHGFTALLARPALLANGVLTNDPGSVKGRTIGLLDGRADDYLAYAGLLQQAGLTIDDVNVTSVSHDGSDRKEAFGRGTVDLVIGRSPAQRYREQAEGWAQIWKVGHEVAPDQQTLTILAGRQFLSERRSVAVRFARAYLRGARAYVDAVDHDHGRAEVLDLIEGAVPESREVLEMMPPAGVHPDGRIDTDRLQADVETSLGRGLLPPPVSASELVEVSIAEDALASLGHYEPPHPN